MNKKLLAGLVAAGLLAGGESATAIAAAGAPAASAGTAAIASSTSGMPSCGPFESLITKGTITKAQAIAIHDAFVSYLSSHWRKTIDTVLGQLVKKHTITQAQASAVTTAITQWVQNNRGHESGDHGICHHGHGDMTGGSGKP